MSDPLLRQWLILSYVPRAPRKLDTATIEERLRNEGIPVNRRTVQRDLQRLKLMFPLECDDKHKPYGWSWIRHAQAPDLPGMSPSTALAFQLVEVYLERLLPLLQFGTPSVVVKEGGDWGSNWNPPGSTQVFAFDSVDLDDQVLRWSVIDQHTDEYVNFRDIEISVR